MSVPNPVTQLRNSLEKVLEDWAETIKDAVLDWDPINERTGEALGLPLPRVEPAPFIEAVRGEVEAMLQRVVQVVNESPTGTINPDSVHEVQAQLAALVNRAVLLGLQMRLDAVETAPEVPAPLPRSEWAKRYRGMAATLPHPGSRTPKPAAPSDG